MRAFTLVEGLLAMVVLLIALIALFGVLPLSFKFALHDSTSDQAVAAGQQYLDAIRQWVKSGNNPAALPPAPVIAIDQGDSMTGNGATLPSAGTFDMTSTPGTCTQLGGASSKAYDCVVTVKWGQASSGTYQVVEETYAVQQ